MASSRTLDRSRLERLMAEELAAFERANPRSRALFEQAKGSLLDGVPMNWMVKWAGALPLFVESASGRTVHATWTATTTSTSAWATPAPWPATALRPRCGRSSVSCVAGSPTCSRPRTPSRRAMSCSRRFGVRYWQFTLTATDANRFVIRLARHITGRAKILVHNHCYHGSVDETFAVIGPDGDAVDRRATSARRFRSRRRPGSSRSTTSRGSSAALAKGDVAACLFEPALTNVGIVLPEPGYHEGVRELTRRYGTLLINDETHTICAGPGGYTRRTRPGAGLPDHRQDDRRRDPGGGLRVHRGRGGPNLRVDRARGLRRRRHRRHARRQRAVAGGDPGNPGRGAHRGGVRADDPAWRALRGRRERGRCGRTTCPWHVTRLGARAEYHFLPEPPRNGTRAQRCRWTRSWSGSCTCGR